MVQRRDEGYDGVDEMETQQLSPPIGKGEVGRRIQ